MEKGKRQEKAAIRPLSFFPFFLAYQLYSCAATRLSQEVITVNLPFNCKIFLQFHPVSEISEKGNERIWFPSLSFYSIRIDSIRPVLWQDFPDFFITSFRGIAWRLFQFNRGYQNLVKNWILIAIGNEFRSSFCSSFCSFFIILWRGMAWYSILQFNAVRYYNLTLDGVKFWLHKEKLLIFSKKEV